MKITNKEKVKGLIKEYDDWRSIAIAEDSKGNKEIKIKCYAEDFKNKNERWKK